MGLIEVWPASVVSSLLVLGAGCLMILVLGKEIVRVIVFITDLRIQLD